jgi:adenine-specific DNA methylase
MDKNLKTTYFGVSLGEVEVLFNKDLKEGLGLLFKKGALEDSVKGAISKVLKDLENIDKQYELGKKSTSGNIRQINKRYDAHMKELEKYNKEITESYKKYLTVLKDTKDTNEVIAKKVDKYYEDVEKLSKEEKVLEENKLFTIISLIEYDTIMMKEEFITMIRTRLENKALLETLQIKTGQAKKALNLKDAKALVVQDEEK